MRTKNKEGSMSGKNTTDNNDIDGDAWFESLDNPSDWDCSWSFGNGYKDITLKIDLDTLDKITCHGLLYHLEMIYEKEHRHKVHGEWYHEEDKEYDRKLKKSIKRILKYFGHDE